VSGVIEALLTAPAERRLFRGADGWITAGEVRAMASGVALPPGADAIYLHTASAARFLAGLLAAAAEDRTVALPAHTQAAYLHEIGCPRSELITDASFSEGRAARSLDGASRDPSMVFFTSGSTGFPKRVAKNLSRVDIEARTLDRLWGKQAGHVIATVSHQHIYGLLFRIVWPLIAGRTSDDAPATYWEDLEGSFKGATLVSSPAHLTRLPPRTDLLQPPPALIFSSGQLLPTPAAQTCIARFGIPVTEVLGSTETGGIAWRRQEEPDAPWTPFDGVSIDTGDGGALIVRSPNLQDDAPMETGDVIAPLDDGRFRLKPRGDRVVKIDGKRVSLTRVEEALAALPEIDVAAALTLPARGDALGAVAQLTAMGREQLAKLGAFRFTRTLRTAISVTLEPSERPKYWRFPEEMPIDIQGKRVLSTLHALFESDPLEPLSLDVRAQSETEAEVVFTLAPELVFFEGHFPEQPILPGVAQAHIAVLIAHRLWGASPPDSNLAKLKFKRVLAPNDTVVLQLKRDSASGRIYFRYRMGAAEVSEGEIGGAKP
jgi:acyl-CoA synthetase (AMP-forming)/AMP-acid ligase II/3-hydroxymyristoyl/3-hydroxydecanoyl-(acyl carrier protein) dehydratase